MSVRRHDCSAATPVLGWSLVKSVANLCYMVCWYRCLRCRHQPLTVRSLLLAALLPFEGQNQWLQLQQQLLQPASGVLTRAQRLQLLGYDEAERKEEELSRDKWLEQLAAVPSPEDANALRIDIYTRLKEQRKQDRVRQATCRMQAYLSSQSSTLETTSLELCTNLKLCQDEVCSVRFILLNVRTNSNDSGKEAR